MKFIIKLIKSENYEGNKIDKESYKVIKIKFEENDTILLDNIKIEADNLASRVNAGAANGSNSEREYSIRYKDALSGLLAEHVCRTAINMHMKREVAFTTECNCSMNQIDIILENNRTIEVRSSCMRNGILFSMFAKKSNGDQYFDIIGPYHADYKPNEPNKDYYMRVLYPTDKISFEEFFNDISNFEMYIVNGATWEMMCDDRYFQLKTLKPNESCADEEGNYRVIPISKGVEIITLLDTIRRQL